MYPLYLYSFFLAVLPVQEDFQRSFKRGESFEWSKKEASHAYHKTEQTSKTGLKTTQTCCTTFFTYVRLHEFNRDHLIVYDFETQEFGIKQAD